MSMLLPAQTLVTGAPDPGRTMVRDAQPSFAGGLDVASEPQQVFSPAFLQQPIVNTLRRAENVRLSQFGAAAKRLGTQRTHVTALPAAIIGGHGWTKSGTGRTTELVIAGNTLYTGTYAIPMTWTNRGGSFLTTGYPSFAPFLNHAGAEVCYIADGGALNYTDGVTATMRLANTANLISLAVYNRRLYGCTGQDDILHGSPLDDGDGIGQAGFVGSGGDNGAQFNIRTFGAQQRLLGLGSIGQSLILVHRNGVSRYTGWSQDDFQIDSGTRGLSSDTGTIARRSLQFVENEGFFLSDRGFYSVTEEKVAAIGPTIEPLFRTLDQSTWNQVCCGHNKRDREVWWAIPTLGVLVFNYRLRQWSGPFNAIYTTQFPGALWQSYDAALRPVLLTGGPDGFVRRCETDGNVLDDVLSDGTGGSRYVMVAKLHRMFAGDPMIESVYRYAYVHADLNGSDRAALLVETEGDSTIAAFTGDPGGVWGRAGDVWGQGTQIAPPAGPPTVWGGIGSQRRKIQLTGRGTYCDLTIIDEGVSPSVYARVDLVGYNLGMR